MKSTGVGEGAEEAKCRNTHSFHAGGRTTVSDVHSTQRWYVGNRVTARASTAPQHPARCRWVCPEGLEKKITLTFQRHVTLEAQRQKTGSHRGKSDLG